MEELKPFDKLDDQQKRCCVDIAIGMAIIAARVPTFSKGIFKDISNEWAVSAGLDSNQCRYALTGVTTTLYSSDWEFHVDKEHGTMVCKFVTRNESPDGGNGEVVLIE